MELPSRLNEYETSFRRAGLVMDTCFWHLPTWSQSHYLVPMEKGPALFALNAILAVPHLRRALARQMFPMAGMRRLLALFWKPVGISIRRPGARPLFQWLFQQECPSSLPAGAIIRTSWRGAEGTSIAYGFSGNQSFPSMIAKTIPREQDAAQPDREAHVLEELGPAARLAGARVPEIIGKQQIHQSGDKIF